MTTEIATTSSFSPVLAEKMEWARALSVGTLLPKHYQQQPGNLLIAAEYADTLGVARVMILTDLQVINGRPSMSANLMATLARKAGHKLRVTGDSARAVAQLVRADDPDFTYEVTWDEAKARRAKLWGNQGPWTQYPDAMLRSRAISEVVRMGAPEVLGGMAYSVDEARDTVEFAPMPTPVAAPAAAPASTVADLLGDSPAPETAASAPAPEPTSEAPSSDEPASHEQQQQFAILCAHVGLTTKPKKMERLEAQFGRPFTSAAEMSSPEAETINALLEAERADKLAAQGGTQ